MVQRRVPALNLSFADGSQVLDSRLTFSRASSATRVGPTGLVELVSAGTPRFDHGRTTLAPLGLLIEGQATNVVPNSEGVGFATGSPGTTPANWTTAPSGTLGLTRTVVGYGTLTGENGGFNYVDLRYSGTANAFGSLTLDPMQATAAVAAQGQTWTSQVWLALVAGSLPGPTNTVQVIERNSAGSFLVSSTTSFSGLTSTLTMFAITRTLSSATAAFVTLGIRAEAIANAATVDFTLRIARPQLEQQGFASSYIPTYGAAATRAADSLTFGGAPFAGLYKPTTGTLVVDFLRRVFDSGAGSIALAQADDGGANNRFTLRLGSRTASPGAQVTVVVGGSLATNTATPVVVTLGASPFKAAATLAPALSSASINGSPVAQAGLSSPMPAATQFNIGAGPSAVSLDGHIRRLTYYPRALSSAELQRITV